MSRKLTVNTIAISSYIILIKIILNLNLLFLLIKFENNFRKFALKIIVLNLGRITYILNKLRVNVFSCYKVYLKVLI